MQGVLVVTGAKPLPHPQDAFRFSADDSPTIVTLLVPSQSTLLKALRTLETDADRSPAEVVSTNNRVVLDRTGSIERHYFGTDAAMDTVYLGSYGAVVGRLTEGADTVTIEGEQLPLVDAPKLSRLGISLPGAQLLRDGAGLTTL